VLVAQDHKFDKDCLAVPAGKAFTIRFDNKDSDRHNVAILPSHMATQTFFQGDIIMGPMSFTYSVPALKPGTWHFHCEIHPNLMNGTFVVGTGSEAPAPMPAPPAKAAPAPTPPPMSMDKPATPPAAGTAPAAPMPKASSSAAPAPDPAPAAAPAPAAPAPKPAMSDMPAPSRQAAAAPAPAAAAAPLAGTGSQSGLLVLAAGLALAAGGLSVLAGARRSPAA
jgi:plastocyanin